MDHTLGKSGLHHVSNRRSTETDERMDLETSGRRSEDRVTKVNTEVKVGSVQNQNKDLRDKIYQQSMYSE